MSNASLDGISDQQVVAPEAVVQTTEAAINSAVAQEPAAEAEVHEVEEVDYSSCSKADFARLLRELSQEADIRKADRTVKQLRPALDELRERLRHEAQIRFVEGGGKQEDFSPRPDDQDLIIDGALKLIREKKGRFNREQDEVRRQNLNKKLELLERLRQVVEIQSATKGFNEFKKIQGEWNAAGPVPQSDNEQLWASYHALVDRFFDQRNIQFELIDLDRRRNSAAKHKLCEKAEALSALPSLQSALREINDLHQEWRKIGPVGKEEKESLWNRFKAASDAIYVRRDQHAKTVAERHSANKAVRAEILSKMETLSSFSSESIKEWNARSAEVAEVKTAWEGAGPVDRDDSREMNKKFWSFFKAFFASKGRFFKQLDAGRQENLERKRAMVNEVRSLQDSEDWESAADRIRQLQRDWKDIGPVPEKFRNSIFEEFRTACDHFFNRRREAAGESERAQEENLAKREQLCNEIAAATELEQVKQLVAAYQQIGMVPRKAVATIRERFEKSQETFFATIADPAQREKARFELSVSGVSNDPDAGRRLVQQEQQVRRQLQQVENDLAVLRNNLGFFARAKNADAVRADFDSKIRTSEEQVAVLKSRLKLIRAQLAGQPV